MTDGEDTPAPYFSLQLQHKKLAETLQSQVEDSKHFDKNATGILRASFAFSAVASAVVYYLSQNGGANNLSSIDNPVTYAGLLFGFVSLFCSVATITHTKIESELNPGDIRKQSQFGEISLLYTAVETYPEYIQRNQQRLSTDKTLLAVSQYSLVLAVVSVILSVLFVIYNRDVTFILVITVSFVAGVIAGVMLLFASISVINEKTELDTPEEG